MSESAADRKARLRAMREEAEVPSKNAPDKEPQLKFRNYLPRDEELLEGQIKAAQAPEIDAITVDPTDFDDEGEEGVIAANVLPKKANFDLRRDVDKKMEKLEKRTQRAMIELMREEEERRMKDTEAEA
eukprot:CAMPEP_0197616356 /NCGR_PEP_ID=MMETSP1326-20131121/60490_1 /TAXON_ID=1155430 /ORGANISM="Genus nov. species nov., Strain RCC2288" /LENGTH=128 /DNA_ID=CAMNT_0043185243 /DNA_START=486 /DNA_END=872 /DNA_ORIENTATION=-